MTEDNLALILNKELAVQMSTPHFTELMQKISTYEVQSSNISVVNDAEYQMATDSLVAVAEVGKSLEQMRKEIVSYPNTFVKTVNATFKTLKDKCERARERISHHALKYKAKKDAEFAKQQAELAAAQQAQVQDIDSGEAPPQPPMQAPPLQSTKATNGKGSVSFRQGRVQFEVINAAKLVRASIDERNRVPSDVISIDAGALRRAIEADLMKDKQWEKYGVKVTRPEEMVVRT